MRNVARVGSLTGVGASEMRDVPPWFVGLGRLRAGESLVWFRDGRIGDLSMGSRAGGQFDHAAVGVAEIDRAHEAVVHGPADLPSLRASLLQHALEGVGCDRERDVQAETVLDLEEREEERSARPSSISNALTSRRPRKSS